MGTNRKSSHTGGGFYVDRQTFEIVYISPRERLKMILVHELAHDENPDHKAGFHKTMHSYISKVFPNLSKYLYVWEPVAEKDYPYEKWKDWPSMITPFEWRDMMIPMAREEMERDLAARGKNGSPSFSEGDDARSAEEKKYMREWFARRGAAYLTPKWAVDDDSLSDLEKYLLNTAIDSGAMSLTIGDPSEWKDDDQLYHHPTRECEIVARAPHLPRPTEMDFELSPAFVQECFDASKDGENPLAEFVKSYRFTM